MIIDIPLVGTRRANISRALGGPIWCEECELSLHEGEVARRRSQSGGRKRSKYYHIKCAEMLHIVRSEEK